MTPVVQRRERAINEAREARRVYLAAVSHLLNASAAWEAARDLPSRRAEHHDYMTADEELTAARLRWERASMALADVIVAPEDESGAGIAR